jgi:hypothetical protein
LLEASDRADDSGAGAMSAGPVHLESHSFAVIEHGDNDPLDQLPHDGLTVRVGRGGGVPQFGDIHGQATNLVALFDRYGAGLRGEEALVVVLQVCA